jgi:hypothetical protein
MPTQSALWGVNYALPERTLGRQYAHPDHRGVTRYTHTQSALWGVTNKIIYNRIPYTMYSNTIKY